MRMVSRIEPTRHVLNLVEFAEGIIAKVAEMGLMPRRRYKRRKSRKAKKGGNPGPVKVTKRKPTKKSKRVHPLAAQAEGE